MTDRRQRRRHRLLGVAFLLLIASLVRLVIALYEKDFTPVTRVWLLTDHTGNQLAPGADVKVRGVIVGEVRHVRTLGDGATLELALDPQRARQIPDDVSAQLLPATLFGERYVSLVEPAQSSHRGLRAGDVIPQDRSSTAMETETALDDLLPLLRSLRPDQLSLTLNALSTALRGRGGRLGGQLVSTDAYLSRLNPSIPKLGDDLAELGPVLDSYAAATPDLTRALDNLAFGSRSLQQQRGALDLFLRQTQAFSTTSARVLQENAERLTELADASRVPLQLYAEQSPGFRCFLAGMVQSEKNFEDVFGRHQGEPGPGAHIRFEVVQGNGGYTPDQVPRYGDTGGGRLCYGLPPNKPVIPFVLYYNPVDGYYDGVPVDPYTGKPPCTHDPCAEPPSSRSSAREADPLSWVLMRPLSLPAG